MLGVGLARSANRDRLPPRIILAQTHTCPLLNVSFPSTGLRFRAAVTLLPEIESQHGTCPCVLHALPNDPAWNAKLPQEWVFQDECQPLGELNRQVGSPGHIASSNYGFSCQALFGFKWGECDVFIEATSPVRRPPGGSIHALQTLPITCSIRFASLHCNRKNWRAYSALPSAWGQFLQNFIHEREGEFTNWLLYLRIILLYEISK